MMRFIRSIGDSMWLASKLHDEAAAHYATKQRLAERSRLHAEAREALRAMTARCVEAERYKDEGWATFDREQAAHEALVDAVVAQARLVGIAGSPAECVGHMRDAVEAARADILTIARALGRTYEPDTGADVAADVDVLVARIESLSHEEALRIDAEVARREAEEQVERFEGTLAAVLNDEAAAHEANSVLVSQLAARDIRIAELEAELRRGAA